MKSGLVGNSDGDTMKDRDVVIDWKRNQDIQFMLQKYDAADETEYLLL